MEDEVGYLIEVDLVNIISYKIQYFVSFLLLLLYSSIIKIYLKVYKNLNCSRDALLNIFYFFRSQKMSDDEKSRGPLTMPFMQRPFYDDVSILKTREIYTTCL